MANVTIDVNANVVQRTLRAAATDLQSEMHRAGQSAGRDFGEQMAQGIDRSTPRVQAAMVKVTESARKLRVEQEKLSAAMASGDYDVIVAKSKRLENAYRQQDSALKSLRTAQSLVVDGMDTVATAASDVGMSFGKAAGPAGVGALVAGLGTLASVASAASGVLALLPGVAAAGGAAMGTLALGTMGFSDALDNIRDPQKFTDAIAALSPNAREAAQDIRSLLPQFDALKNATQDALFAGIGPQIQQLSATLLPEVQKLTTTVATSFNTMFSGAFSNPATLQAIETTMQNIGTAFENLAPAAAPFTQAIAELASAGSSFLPQLADEITQAAQAFSQFISQASSDGSLQEFIQRGIDVTGQFIDVIGNLADLFFALGPAGESAMTTISTSVQTTSDLIKVLGGDVNALTDLFPSFGETVASTFSNLGGILDWALVRPLRAVIDLINKIPGIKLPGIPEFPTLNGDGSITVPGFGGGGGSFGIGSGAGAPGPGQPGGPSGPGGAYGPGAPGYGGIGGSAVIPPSGPSWGPTPNPFAYTVPKAGAGGGGTGGDLTARNGDPMQLIQGFAVTSSLYGAASTVLDARHDVEEKQAQLNKLEKDGTATAAEIQAAKNDLLQSQQKSYESELRLSDAKQSATNKLTDQYGKAADSLNSIGVQLDSDFGISKGLPGIVENLTKFIGNLAAAPYLGQLQAIQDADPRKGGYGVMGILGAQGKFGPENTGLPQDTQQQGYPQQGYGAQGYGAPGTAMPGESARDFAHRVEMPHFQSQGYTVGDHNADKYGEHQNGALDIMVGSIAEGQKVLAQVLSDANTYGAIFNNQVYGYGQGMQPRPYSGGNTGNPTQDHQDHVHAFFKPGGANNIPGGGQVPMAQPTIGAPAPASQVPGNMPNNLPIPLPVVIVGGGAPIGAPPVGPPMGAPAPAGVPGPGAPGSPRWGIPAAPGLPPGITGGGGQSPIFGATPQGPGVGAAAGQSPVGYAQGSGGWQPQGGGGIGVGGGAMDAAMMAAGGLDLVAPGAGQAAATAGKLANRSIQFAGQLASIGVEGLMQTFLPSGSELGDPSKSWLGRVASGVAGMKPATPTTAGQNQGAQQQQGQQQGAQGNSTNYSGVVVQGDFVQAPGRTDGQKTMNDLAFQSHAKGGR